MVYMIGGVDVTIRPGDIIKIRSWRSIENEYGLSHWNPFFPGWGKEFICKNLSGDYVEICYENHSYFLSLETIGNICVSRALGLEDRIGRF